MDTERVREYAETCRSLISVEMAAGAAWERQFEQWVKVLEAVEPPPELSSFHINLTNQYSAQIEAGGPSSEAQAAYERWQDDITLLEEDVILILLDTGCLTELDLAVVVAQNEARVRMEARQLLARPLTVQEYAEHCKDIERTVPIMDDLDGLLTHLILEWRKLLPPPELERFHGYIQEVYLYWKEHGEVEGPTRGAAILLVNEVESFSPETRAILIGSDCIKGE